MSDAVVLTLRAPLAHDLDAECVAPDRFADLARREIGELPVWAGRTRARLSDFFAVDGERAARVRVCGDVGRVHALGRGMRGGALDVEGSAGDAGHDAGAGMAGGVLCVSGRAGDNVGGARAGESRGMSGGEIVVRGAAGS